MLFSTDLIEESNSKIPESNEEQETGITTSYFEYAVQSIQEGLFLGKKGKSLKVGFIDIAKKIKEFKLSDIKTSLNFSTSFGNDFNGKAHYMINDLYDKIVAAVKEDKSSGFYKYVVENKSGIKYQNIVYKNECYEKYTNITAEKNTASIKSDLVKIFETFETICIKLSKAHTPNEFNDAMSLLKKTSKEYKDKSLSMIRGRLVNQYFVKDEDFPSEILKFFRGGTDHKKIYYIPAEGEYNMDSLVSEAVNGYLGIKDTLEFVTQYSTKMQKDVYNACRLFDNRVTVQFPESMYRANSIKELYKLFDIIQTICNIYLLYLAAKLDATYEKFQRDRSITKEAASEYRKQSNKEDNDYD